VINIFRCLAEAADGFELKTSTYKKAYSPAFQRGAGTSSPVYNGILLDKLQDEHYDKYIYDQLIGVLVECNFVKE
jgi:hypothetical protein